MPLLSDTQHQRLLELVLAEVGEEAEVSDDGWSVTNAAGVMGLYNLSQTLSGIPEKEWAAIVKDWVSHLATPPELPETFEKAEPHLRIRLAADASEPGWASYRPVCEGLDQMLVIRNELGAVTVSDAQLETWDSDPEVAWKAALEHTIWDEARERVILERDGIAIVWVRHNFFASSVLLSMGHLLSPRNRFGAVVMVPIRDALLYAEVNDERVVAASAGMIEIGGRWFVDEPGAISPDLFWYRPEGDITRLVKAVDRRYQPCWGPDFSVVLAELSADMATVAPPRRNRSKKSRTPTIPG